MSINIQHEALSFQSWINHTSKFVTWIKPPGVPSVFPFVGGRFELVIYNP